MKTIMCLLIVFSYNLSFAGGTRKPAKSCDATAEGAAKDYMSQQMDEACAKERAKILKKASNKGKINYTIDVLCGPDVPDNHFEHDVEVDAKTCNVLSGGGGDA